MRVEEFLERLVAAGSHAREFGALEGVHGDAADERNVNAETAVDAGAGEAHEDAEFGRGLQGDSLAGVLTVERGDGASR